MIITYDILFMLYIVIILYWPPQSKYFLIVWRGFPAEIDARLDRCQEISMNSVARKMDRRMNSLVIARKILTTGVQCNLQCMSISLPLSKIATRLFLVGHSVDLLCKVHALGRTRLVYTFSFVLNMHGDCRMLHRRCT